MQDYMFALVMCSMTMSALALIYMAAMPLLAKHYSAKGLYYTWLIIVVGFIIPFRPSFADAVVKVEMPVEMTRPILRMGNGTPMIQTDPAASVSSAFSSISVWQVVMIVWLFGVVAFLMYHAIKHYRFAKLVGRWSERVTDGQPFSILEGLKAEMGGFTSVDLQICASVDGPMMTGFFHPRIVLPKRELVAGALRDIFAHELVHYRRRDLWYKVLVLMATAIHWFNPVVYMAARAINVLCELSCDEEVVRGRDADARLAYSETIISVIRCQPGPKTALSTNFYGGKRDMKKRIISIMDMHKKKAGCSILGGALLLTMGTGAAFATNMDIQNPPEIIKEQIVVAPMRSVRFLPDPDIYAAYAAYGITVSEDGTKLLYEGKLVRLFVDENAETEAFYLNEAGSENLSVERNDAGKITRIKHITAQKAQDYQEAFFAEEYSMVSAAQEDEMAVSNKYTQYQPFGITCSANNEILYYHGERVKFFVDKLADGWFYTSWTDNAGTINLEAVRDASGQIVRMESISEEKAQEYRSAIEKYEERE